MINENRINRLSPEEEQGRRKGGRVLEEASFITGGNSIAGGSNQGTDNRIQNEEQIKLLIQYADSNNLWWKDHDSLGTYIDHGDEQTVFARPEEMMVYKYNDMSFHDSCVEFFDRLAIHNYLYPEAYYEMLGFTYSKKDIFSIVVRQPFVVCDRGAYREEVIKEMAKQGYTHHGGTTFFDSNYIIEDLHPGNVLKLHNGDFAFIDPVIYLNTPDQDMGGSRQIGEY